MKHSSDQSLFQLPRHCVDRLSKALRYWAFSKHSCPTRTDQPRQNCMVKGLKTNLLGLPTITSLQLIGKLCATEVKNKDIWEQFPEVFTGLGTFGEEYEIKLKENATPFALYAPRNIPIPLRHKVQQELDGMQKLGVIRKVSEPTPWCAGMVVVPKKSGAIRT